MKLKVQAWGALAVVAAVLLLGGCGGGESAEAAVRRTVDDFTASVASGDFPSGCNALASGIAKALKLYAEGTCSDGLKAKLEGNDEELGALTISKVTIQGEEAVVAFSGNSGVVFKLSEEDGAWKIKAL